MKNNVVVETNISQCCLMFSLIVCVNFIVVKRFFIEKIVLKRWSIFSDFRRLANVAIKQFTKDVFNFDSEAEIRY